MTKDAPISNYNELKNQAIGAFNEIHLQACENFSCPLHVSDKILWPNTSNVSNYSRKSRN